jgi:hypothetical protein
VRLSALSGITVTMVTYVSLLAPVHHPTGSAAITNVALQYVAPILAIIGWLLSGPRPRIDQETLAQSLAWPAAYIVYTLIHGATSQWYPYPFVDVTHIGYATSIRNGIGMARLLIGAGALYMYADSRVGRRGTPLQTD